MAIRGRNLDTGAKLSVGFLAGDAAPYPVSIGYALRTSITLNEAGVTIMGGSGSNDTLAGAAAGKIITLYAMKPGIDPSVTIFPFANLVLTTAMRVGDEFTTRDGSLSFYDNSAGSDGLGGAGLDKDYRNSGNRVFPKGTIIRAKWAGAGASVDTGNNSDGFACWADIEEYGAAPATG